ncbi:MAG: hypothetical protein ACFE8E_14215 [Candidatus Hodarchaeota archaeon]
MIKNLTQFYKIGKELGLKKTEISRTFLFLKNRSLIIKILLILVLSLITIVVVVIIVVGSRSVYPSGTLYSTIKLNDFKNKK